MDDKTKETNKSFAAALTLVYACGDVPNSCDGLNQSQVLLKSEKQSSWNCCGERQAPISSLRAKCTSLYSMCLYSYKMCEK